MSKMISRKSPGAAFISDEGGNTVMIFGLAFVPVMLMLGATSDYTKFTTTRSQLQQATDASVLKVATHPDMSAGNMTEAKAKERLQVQINAQPNMGSATVDTTTISQDKQTLCATTRATVQNSFMQMAQIPSLTAQAKTCANLAWGVNPNTTYEIALVLDNSTSMLKGNSSSTKMDDLKAAANSFVETMFNKATTKVQFSVTPFAGGVTAVNPNAPGARTSSWIDLTGDNSQHWIAFGGKTAATAAGFTNRFSIYNKLKQRNSTMDWGGCFESLAYPYNVQDVTPSAGDPETRFVPYLAPDNPASYTQFQMDNNYIDDNGGTSQNTSKTCSGTAPTDRWALLARACKYNQTATMSGDYSYATANYFGPNAFCPSAATQTIMHLSNDKSAIKNKITNLVALGNTNLHEGFMWGWRTLSPNGPFQVGRSYTTQNNRKIMVFMTDGFNNWSSLFGSSSSYQRVGGSTYEALGFYTNNGAKNARLPNGQFGDGVDYQTMLQPARNASTNFLSKSRTAQDELTLEACTNAKNAGIEVFTIGFSISTDPIDAQGLALLKACATNDEHYFAVQNASELNAAFSTIGVGLGKLRLTQ